MSQVDLWAYERACWEEGATLVCGVDEAGRGPWPVPCAAAVILPRDLDLEEALPGLNDSKSSRIKSGGSCMGGFKTAPWPGTLPLASQEEIDAVNIFQATFLAMGRAVAGLGSRPEWALVDGNRDPGLEVPTKLIVKGGFPQRQHCRRLYPG